MKFIIAILISSILILPNIILGQPLTFYENDYEILHYHDSKSLHTDVSDVWRDDQGQLWIVNIGSLYCFDGYDFERYQPDEATMMNDARDQLQQVVKDKSGNLWLSSIQGGVLKYDASSNRFLRYRINEEAFTDFNSSGIAIDSFGNVWVAFTSGLLQMDNSDSTRLNIIEPKSLAQELLPLVDSIATINKAIVSHSKVINDQRLSQSFRLEKNSELLIIGQGEILKTPNYSLPIYDYVDIGWIADDTGQTVWSMDIENSYNAGRLIDVRINADFVTLPAGDYVLHYQSDDFYAYDQWIYAGRKGATGPSKRYSPPSVPDWWGIQVFEVSNKEKELVSQEISDYEGSRKLTSSHTGIFKDMTGAIWVFGRALEELSIRSESSYEFIKHADWNLKDKNNRWNQILGIDDKDEENLWMFVGVVDDSGNQHLKLGIYNKANDEFTEVKTDLPNEFRYWTIKNDHQGNLWIGGYYDSGLYKLSPPFLEKTEEAKANLVRFDLAESGKDIWRIKSMEVDDFNNLWIGTHQQGLYKINLDPLPFQYLDFSNLPEMEGKRLTSIKEDSHGHYWMTTSPFSLIQYDISSGEIESYHDSFKGIPFDMIAFSTELQNSHLLFQTDRDLIEYDILRDRAILRDVPGVSMTSQAVTRISFCKGFIYNDSLVYIPGFLINTKDWTVDKDLKQYIEGSRWSAIKSQKGGLWISRSWSEYLRLDFRGDKVDTLEAQMSFAYTLDLLEDKDEQLWIANNFNTKKMGRGDHPTQFFTVEKGLQKPNYVAKIFEHDQYIWQFTSLGNSLINTETNTFSNPGMLADLAILDAFKDKKDNLVLMGEEGVYIFDPYLFKSDDLAPKAVIKSVAIEDNSELQYIDFSDVRESLVFDYTQNDLTIDYVGIQFNNPDKTTYSYQLKGSSDEWQDVNNDRTARFLNLPPDDYIFSIKAANENGIWSEPEILKFSITPPWWNNWISRTFYILLSFGLLYAFVKSRLEKLKKERNDKKELAEALIIAQEEERKRIARDLHDGVGQSLLLIKKQLESTSKVTRENKSLITETLEEVRSISQDLHPFQLEKFGLKAAIEETLRKIEKASSLFISKEIEDIDDEQLPKNAGIYLYRTIQEGFNNIVKHSEATAAKVTLTSDGRNVRVQIQDNGKGFDYEIAVAKSRSLGLRTMHERVTSIGGKFIVTNNEPSGTIIEILIPFSAKS